MDSGTVSREPGSLPIYCQVKKKLEQKILNSYQTGDSLPSENVLAEQFGINRHTLRRAVDELIEAGFVERVHGRGTFVLEPAINYAIGSNTRFTATLENQGRNTESKILKKGKIPAEGGVAKRLQIKVETPVIFIETIRFVDGLPFCVISHFLPFKSYEFVLDFYNKGSLHNFIQEYCHIKLRRIESLISAVLPQMEDARLLNMPKKTPILRVKSINVNIDNEKPAEYAVTRFRGDATQLSINL